MTSTDLEDRRAQLDTFAAQPPREQHNLPVAVGAFSAPAERVFGAQQVAVYRDEARILQRLKVLAAAAGENWYYRYPVKNKRKGTTDWIEGPSIKLANDVARIYGNSDIDVRVLDLGASWLIYARFLDLETGFSLTRPFQQQKAAGKIGGDDDARRLDIAFQIGVSKAIRNVVVNGLQTFSDFAFEEARDALVSRISGKLAEYRNRVLQRLDDLKVEPRRAELVIGRAAPDWLAPDIAKLIAMLKAIADGMASISETFPTAIEAPSQTEHDPETGEIKEEAQNERVANTQPHQPHQPTGSAAADGAENDSLQGSDVDQRAADANTVSPMSAARSDSRSGPEDGRESGGKRQASKPSESGGAPSTSSAGASSDPRAEGEYVAHAETWIRELTNAAAGVDRWKREKTLRNHCNVAPEVRDKLESLILEKIDDLKKKEQSADVERHDRDLATAANKGGAALDAAIANVPEPHRTTLRAAIERRHRPAAAAVDSAKAST